MVWFHMIRVAIHLVWPYVLTPWRSPLLRWRIETYGLLDERGQLLHADQIGASRFLRFISSERRALWRFLWWATTIS